METVAHYDWVVIGAGPAGEKSAAQAAYFGKRVAIIEKGSEPGGAAVHTGTLPSKTLREACLYLTGHRNRDIYGVAVNLSADATLQKLMDRRGAISAAEALRMRNNLGQHEVTYYEGIARFDDPHSVTVKNNADNTEQKISGDYFLIATGSTPFRPDSIPFASGCVFDTDDILSIPAIPESLTILGAGVIGCEYACMFAALGTKVNLVDVRDTIMPFLDHDIIDRLVEAMQKSGVEFHLGDAWHSVAVKERGKRNSVNVKLASGTALHSSSLLFAAGRSGNSRGLNLETLGVAIDSRGAIEVNNEYRTSIPHIFAAGDVVGFPALASTSMEQGRVAACHAFGIEYKQAMSSVLPYGIYTIPEVSAVGETEETAKEKNLDVVVGRSLYQKNARGMIAGDLDGVTKLIIDRNSKKILGVHVIGERATELVHIGQAALLMDATVDLFIDMVFNFPTLAESYKYAAYDCLRQLN